ncbi:MAG TPA: HAD family hydrolase [Gaiellaceae bacterium]|nr:HAD family hydrolase [Gaiellaceae bacterium]
MRAVFLDRDGVLNRLVIGGDGVGRPPAGVDQLELLPGVDRACRRLKAAGFALLVATNQPDVARGRLSRGAVEEVNAALAERLPLDEILVCYHDDADGCACRKPQPGLLLEAAGRWRIDLAQSYLVGDRPKDITAGRHAGCTTILVGRGDIGDADHRASGLADAATWLLQRDPAPTMDAARS